MDAFHEKIDAARKPVSRLIELVTSFCAWEKKRKFGKGKDSATATHTLGRETKGGGKHLN